MKTIKTIDDPAIQEFRSLRDSSIHNQHKIIAESEKVVLKLLRSNLDVYKILATPDFYNKHSKIIENCSCQKLVAPKIVLQEIVGYKLHHGVLALGQRPKNASIQELRPPILVLNGLVSAENVGAIVRNCTAFGIKSILCDSQSCSPYIRRAIRVSMGNIFAINIRETDRLVEDLLFLQERNIRIISTANIPNSSNLHDFRLDTTNFAVVIGNEGYGIQKDVLTISDHIVRIAIDANVAAINAACASAVFLYALTTKIGSNQLESSSQ